MRADEIHPTHDARSAVSPRASKRLRGPEARLPTCDRKDEVWKQTNAARRVLCRFVRVMWTMFASLLAIFLNLGVTSGKGRIEWLTAPWLPNPRRAAPPRRLHYSKFKSPILNSYTCTQRPISPPSPASPRRALDHGMKAGPRSAPRTCVPSAGCPRPYRSGYTGRGFQLDLAASKTLASPKSCPACPAAFFAATPCTRHR